MRVPSEVEARLTSLSRRVLAGPNPGLDSHKGARYPRHHELVRSTPSAVRVRGERFTTINGVDAGLQTAG